MVLSGNEIGDSKELHPAGVLSVLHRQAEETMATKSEMAKK